MSTPKRKISRQFGDWASDLKHDVFESARLRLTFYYFLFIATILATFSVVLFMSFSYRLTREFGHDRLRDFGQEQLAQTKNNLRANLFLTDMIILFLATGLSYILAGETLRPIKRTLEKQKRFTADASHELRTPLAVIKTESEVMQKNPNLTTADYAQLVTSTLEEVDRMSKIVENLLEVSRSEHQETVLQKTPLEFSTLIETVTKKLRLLAEKKGVTLVTEQLSQGTIYGDSVSINQMLDNIIQNAIKYTPASGTITVSLVARAASMVATITDTGIGIAPDHLPYVFEPFYKSDRARTGHKGGAGLGLSIVAGVVESHNGRISIESQVDHGTTITIEFPKI